MKSSYLQFLFAMVLVIDGIMCQRDQGMLRCQYSGNDDIRNFTVAANKVLQNISLDVNANITCDASGSWRGRALFSFKIVCPDEWQILLHASPMDINRGIIVKAFYDEEEEEHNISKNTGPIILLSKDNMLEISATYSDNDMRRKGFMLSTWTVKVSDKIDPDLPDSSCTPDRGNGPRKLELSCPTNSFYDIALISFDDGKNERLFTVICWFDVSYQPTSMRASCSRMPGTLQVDLTVPMDVDTSKLNLGTIFFLRYAPDSLVGSRSVIPMTTVTTTGQSQPTTVNPTTTVTTTGSSQPNSANPMTTVTTNGSSQPNSGKGNTASIVVPTVVLLVAVFLLVALAATIWRKRRNKQASAHAKNVSANTGPYRHNHVSSEGGDATDKSPRYVTSNAGPEGDGTVALNIRSTVNQNEETLVYNEIGEQDYNTLFGGKEKDDYHEYTVPDRPQGKSSVDRSTVSGSGPYQELLQDGTRAVAAVNRSPEVTGPRHGVADDLHAYQDLRQDERSVSGIHPNGELSNPLPSKDTPATENGYQALKTTTPEYATLEPSPEYATLEQNDQSMTGTSDVSGPASDKQYDTLQRSLNTVGQPPSAGYGTLKPMNETDADYESPDGMPKTTSDFEDPTRPTEALPNNQPKDRHSVSYDDDDYQTPIEPAEDLTNAYQTLDNPGYQQEPDTQVEEYSHLQRSLGAKLQSHPSSNHDNSDSHGKLHLNGTP